MLPRLLHKNIHLAIRPEATHLAKKLVSTGKLTQDLFTNYKNASILKRLELSEDFVTEVSSKAYDLSSLYESAKTFALENGARYIELEHILVGVLFLVPNNKILFAKHGLSFDDVKATVYWVISEREKLAKLHVWQEDYEIPAMSGVGKGMTGHVTPHLDSVSTDLTYEAQSENAEKIISHKEEISKIIELLSGENTNVLIVGPPGCGKTSAVKGIAQRIVTGSTSDEAIRFKRIVAIDTAALLSGTKSAGDISKKITDIMDEVKSSKDIILFFDEIHNFVSGSASQDSSSIFSLLEPHISGAKIQFIGATNIENYRKHIESNGSFSRLFEMVELKPTSKEETLKVLEDVAKGLEYKYNILISYPALKGLVDLSAKLMHERVFPDKAIDVLNRTCSESRRANGVITLDDVKSEISELTHVPVTTLSENEAEKLLNIEKSVKIKGYRSRPCGISGIQGIT